MNIQSRLSELGLQLPPTPRPAGNYEAAVQGAGPVRTRWESAWNTKAPVASFDVPRSLQMRALILAATSTLLLASCGPNPSAKEPTNSPGATPTGGMVSRGSVTALNLKGNRVPLFATSYDKATVLLFLATECPISNRYAPEIRRLEEKYAPLGIRFWRVYSDPEVSPDAIRSHLQAHGFPPEALQDPGHALVRLSQVRVTPEAAVFLPGGRLIYHGRIDDRYVAFGQERPTPGQRDLAAALDAILQNRPVPSSHAPAVGCYIPDSK